MTTHRQFINYNINDVSDMYRKATTTPSTHTLSESTSCTQQQDNSELFLVKETLATLQSDVLSLKRSVHDSNNKMDSLCAELQPDLRNMKDAIQNCVIHMNNDSTNGAENETLSSSLQSLANTASKLQTSRNTAVRDISELRRSVQDNSSNVQHLKDSEFSAKSNCEHSLSDLRNEFQEQVNVSTADLVSTQTYELL